MRKTIKFSPEVRERTVRMVFDHRGEYESQWAAVVSTAKKIGSTPPPGTAMFPGAARDCYGKAFQGSMTTSPPASNGLVSRVATIRPCIAAVAAM